MDEGGQLDTLRKLFPVYMEEFTPQENTGLSLVDSFILYCQIRHHKPKRMVEIGSGESTMISLQALERNRQEGVDCLFSAVEPFPREALLQIDFPGFELVVEQVENLGVDFFHDTDFLFIDSSHVSKIGSDVNFEILEVVPSLKQGAVIHWHDIMIPGNYWEDWTREGNKFWNESYLLHAFLQFNDSFRVLWASRYMHMRFPEEMRKAFPFMKLQERCTSFWVIREQ